MLTLTVWGSRTPPSPPREDMLSVDAHGLYIKCSCICISSLENQELDANGALSEVQVISSGVPDDRVSSSSLWCCGKGWTPPTHTHPLVWDHKTLCSLLTQFPTVPAFLCLAPGSFLIYNCRIQTTESCSMCKCPVYLLLHLWEPNSSAFDQRGVATSFG